MSHRTTNPYALNAGTVLVLQSMTSYPSVSLLLPTTPGQMTASDRARFHGLRETAARRLQEEVSAPDGRDFSADRILVELDQLRDHAADLTLDRGLALFVNEHHAQLVILPDAVAEPATWSAHSTAHRGTWCWFSPPTRPDCSKTSPADSPRPRGRSSR